jgi:hypothetical protein
MGGEYSQVKMNLRQEALKILLKKFSDKGNNRSIYECADEWCGKQSTTAGLVSYYEAYYNK